MGDDFRARIEDLAVTDEQDQHPGRYAETIRGQSLSSDDPGTTRLPGAIRRRRVGRTPVRGRGAPRVAALHQDERCGACRGACDIVVPGIERGTRTRDTHRRRGSAKTRATRLARVTRHGSSSSCGIAVVPVRDRRCLLSGGDTWCRCSRARGDAGHSAPGCGPCAHANP